MKRCLWLLPLVVFAAIEAQTGSNSAPPLPADFNVVYPTGGFPSFPGSPDLRILTWNIDHGAHLSMISDGLNAFPAEIYLLQEVDRNATRSNEADISAKLSERLRMNAVFGIEFEELSQEQGSRAYIGQATLSRLRFVQSRVLRFRRQSGFWRPRPWLPSSLPLMQRRLGDRIALVSELDWRGHPLVIYNAHLESRSAGFIQEKQLDEMLADAKRYPPDTIIVLGGDLNTKYLPSLFLHKLEGAGFHSALGERIQRTHHILLALDWIFARGPVTIESGAIEHAARGSDHYPLYAVLHLNP